MAEKKSYLLIRQILVEMPGRKNDRPVMVIVAGANGSGKSTLTSPYFKQGLDIIDPDRIAKDLCPSSPLSVAMSAGKMAIILARENIRLSKSFSIETTLSSKGVSQRLLQAAKNNHYLVTLVYISTIDPQINIERVADRVAKGGHDVPEADIARRYYRSLNNLAYYFDNTDEKRFFDNSQESQKLKLLFSIDRDGRTVYATPAKELPPGLVNALGAERLHAIFANQQQSEVLEKGNQDSKGAGRRELSLNEAMLALKQERTDLPSPPTKAQTYAVNYQWSKEHKQLLVTVNDEHPREMSLDILRKIAARDQFLKLYSLKTIQSGKLDLSVAKGVQPVPDTFNAQGEYVQKTQDVVATKLKH